MTANLVRFIVLFVVLTLLSLLSGARGCSSVVIHPSHNATYISQEYCMVSTLVPNGEFTELLAWCNALHTKP